MRIRRKGRPKSLGSWTPESSRRAHEAKAKKRLARAAEGWAEPEPERVPAGEFLGVLQWSAVDGSVRRYVVRQGRRVNGIAVWPFVVGAKLRGREMGWDAFLSGLRRRLSMPKRRLRMGPDG